MSWLPFMLPDPGEKIETQRKPFEKQEGIYILAREAGDTEVNLFEPKGDTYTLEYFECESFLKGILHLKEMYLLRILDYLWNFFRVAFDPTVEHVVILKTVDPEGWETEVKDLFKDTKLWNSD